MPYELDKEKPLTADEVYARYSAMLRFALNFQTHMIKTYLSSGLLCKSFPIIALHGFGARNASVTAPPGVYMDNSTNTVHYFTRGEPDDVVAYVNQYVTIWETYIRDRFHSSTTLHRLPPRKSKEWKDFMKTVFKSVEDTAFRASMRGVIDAG